MKIQLANQSHYNDLLVFYNEIVSYLKLNHDDPGWTHGDYPFELNINNALDNHCMYIGLKDNKIVCAVIMNNEYSKEYEKIKWKDSLDDAYILHTLAVHPQYLRHSYAKHLLTFCINKAMNDHKKHICLDVYEYNKPARQLYEAMGFLYVDKVSMGFECLGLDYFCLYEKML